MIEFKDQGCECVDWIHLAQNMNQWRALMHMVMNLRFSRKAKNILPS
jgi:hypothetical protein